jgi:3-deoxy-7-phosphoheptulonate synthase
VSPQADKQHGNTKSAKTDTTLKTRHFVDIVTEITRSMEIHREMGTILGGVHLELTGEVNDEGFSVVGPSLHPSTDADDSDRMYWRINGARGQRPLIQLQDPL